MEVFRPSHSEGFACCALTIQYTICSTVGWSIASISDLGGHIYLGASCLSKYVASGSYIYISCGPNRTICTTSTSVQLTTTEDESLNGFMVASREDTGPMLDGSAPYVGSWEVGTDTKLVCAGVSI